MANAKLRIDQTEIEAMMAKHGLNKDLFTKKITAMMVGQFLATADEHVADIIINSVQVGSINRTYEKFVNISYETAAKDVKLTKEETAAMGRVQALVKQGNKEIEFIDVEASREAGRRRAEEDGDYVPEDVTWSDYFFNHMKLWTMVGVLLLLPTIYLGTRRQ